MKNSIELLNIDCMEYMVTKQDNAFDLAIVDPPYAHGRLSHSISRLSRYGDMQRWNKVVPDKKYFDELMRVSHNQIIWGANYFNLPPGQGFIFWYKHQPAPFFADGEMAWTSFDVPAKCFDYRFFGSIGADKERIHPTQKPIKLYEWLLLKYAKPGQRILDTHLGSGSSAIACYYAGHDFVGCEIDKEIYRQAKDRFGRETRQEVLSFDTDKKA